MSVEFWTHDERESMHELEKAAAGSASDVDAPVMRYPTQSELMTHDPATGEPKPYPSHSVQWRSWNGDTAWLFNPWTGERRTAADIGSDTFGMLIRPPKTDLYSA